MKNENQEKMKELVKELKERKPPPVIDYEKGGKPNKISLKGSINYGKK